MEKAAVQHEEGPENGIATPQKEGKDLEGSPTPINADFERDEIAQLSPEHREYLLHRHGTLDLDPVPDMSDADPYNWPTWKVSSALYLPHVILC